MAWAPSIKAEENHSSGAWDRRDGREGEGTQLQSCGLMGASLDLPLALAKLLIPMTIGRCLHLSGPQCYLYNRGKKSLTWPG